MTANCLYRVTSRATGDNRTNYVAVVRAVRAVYAGNYFETANDLLTPNRAAIREALPHYWRKAFDRTTMWHLNGTKSAHCDLRSTRGRSLATINCEGYVYEGTQQ